MAEDQSDQTDDLPESNSEEDSKSISSSPASSEKLGHSKEPDQVDEIPTEILDALPPEMRQAVSASFTAMVHSAPSRQSPLAKNITPEHISTILVNSDNDSRRDFDLKRLLIRHQAPRPAFPG